MKIIVLDDSPTILMFIESYLEELGVDENEIFSFESGFEALKFIKRQGADIVFSDINMPKMSGYDFARKLFILKPHLKSATFGISGDENKESYQRMKNNGVRRFIKKPINAQHFNHFVAPEILKRRMLEKTTY